MKNHLLALIVAIPMIANCQTFEQSRTVAATTVTPQVMTKSFPVKVTTLAFSSKVPATAYQILAMKSGGVDAGGGNLCYINGRPVLLEFADLSRRLNEPGIRIEPTAVEQVFGFSSFQNLSDGGLKNKINQIFTANEKKSPIVTSWFRLLIGAVPFSFVSASIIVPVKADTSRQQNCQQENVRASMIFMPEGFALADRNKFNLLDLDSQAGLVIHEGARLLQRLQHYSADKYNVPAMTDLQLQALVRHMYDVYLGYNLPSLDQDGFFDTFYFRPQSGFTQREVTLNNVKNNIQDYTVAIWSMNLAFVDLELGAEGYLENKDSWFLTKEQREGVRETRKNSCNVQANLNEWLRIGAPKSYGQGVGNMTQALTQLNSKCSKFNK